MRTAGIVEAVRDGRAVRYQLADPEILAACGLMRSVLVRRLSRLGDLAAAAVPTDLAVAVPRTALASSSSKGGIR
jgi:DNA-binding transcriptional ArsR family regulator